MPASGSNFRCPPRLRLTTHIRHVRNRSTFRRSCALRLRDTYSTGQFHEIIHPTHNLCETAGSQDRQPRGAQFLVHRDVDKRGLRSITLRDDHAPQPGAACRHQHGKYPSHRPQRTVQPDLTQQHRLAEALANQRISRAGGENGQAHGDVEMRTGFGHGCWREADHDLCFWPVQLGVGHGGFHAVAGFRNSSVSEPNDLDTRQPRPYIGLHIDDGRGDPHDRCR